MDSHAVLCVGKRSLEGSPDECPKRNACDRFLVLTSIPRDELNRRRVSMYLCTDESYSMQIERVTHGSHPQRESVDTPGR